MSNDRKEDYQHLDHLPGALLEVDLDSRQVVYMNLLALSLFEYNQGEIDQGLPLRDIFESEAEYKRSIETVESFGLESFQEKTAYTHNHRQMIYDFHMKRKGGGGFVGECQGAFVLDQNQVPVAVRIYIRDQSDKRDAEAQHIENEIKYRTLVDYSSDIIFLIDMEGLILSVNRSATKYLQRELTEIEGKNLSDLFPAQTVETIKGYLNKAFISGKRATYETPMPMTNRSVWISTSMNPVLDRAGNITAVLGVSRDITAWKRAEERLEQALVDARNANRVKDQFLSNITHEIRTPLTTITGFTARLKKSLGDNLEAAEKDYFKFIIDSSERLLTTVESILEISQLEAGTIHLHPKRHNLGQLIQLICDQLTPDAEAKGITLDWKQETDQDSVIYDQTSIYQAINNIMQNAIKYTDKGGVDVRLRRSREHLELTFTDTGIGISDEYRQRLFQVFSQESEGLTKSYQGMGLGLALTKRYLDLNQVEIQVQSEKGFGSTFTFIFPDPPAE